MLVGFEHFIRGVREILGGFNPPPPNSPVNPPMTPRIFSSKMLHFGWWERSWLNLIRILPRTTKNQSNLWSRNVNLPSTAILEINSVTCFWWDTSFPTSEHVGCSRPIATRQNVAGSLDSVIATKLLTRPPTHDCERQKDYMRKMIVLKYNLLVNTYSESLREYFGFGKAWSS
jgi:hypothetical protein